MNQETLRQLTKQKEDSGGAGGSGRKVSEVVTYRDVKDMPSTREMAIQARSAWKLTFERDTLASAAFVNTAGCIQLQPSVMTLEPALHILFQVNQQLPQKWHLR